MNHSITELSFAPPITPSPARGFLFDLGGVLVELGFDEATREFERRTRCSRDAIAEFLFTAPPSVAFEEGRLTPRQYFHTLQQTLRFDGDYDVFVRLWNAWVRESPPMTALLARLASQYRVGIISNTNVLHVRHLLETPSLFRHVHRCVMSCAVGARKPQPRIYDMAIAQLRLPAEDIVYVDDRLECVEQGRRLGLRTIHFTGHDPFIAALRAMGIHDTASDVETQPAINHTTQP